MKGNEEIGRERERDKDKFIKEEKRKSSKSYIS